MMNYEYVIQKVRELRGQGELSQEEGKLIEKALRAWKQRFLLVAALIVLVIMKPALWTNRDRLSPGTTRYHSQGAVWEFRWVSPPPKKPISFFTGGGRWQYRPGNSSGYTSFDDHRIRYGYKPRREPWRPPQGLPKDVDNSDKTPQIE